MQLNSNVSVLLIQENLESRCNHPIEY